MEPTEAERMHAIAKYAAEAVQAAWSSAVEACVTDEDTINKIKAMAAYNVMSKAVSDMRVMLFGDEGSLDDLSPEEIAKLLGD